MKKIWIPIFLCLLAFSTSSVQVAGFNFPLDTDGELIVVIDPGHGGDNLGADYNGFVEKEMNMIVANAMYEELSKYEGVTIYMTHTNTTDKDMSLKARADYAKSVNADFLFCLHFNMSPQNNLYGSEVWVSAFDDENREGYRFGTVQMNTMKELGLYIRGVKTRFNSKGTDYYGILREAKANGIAAALIEHCHVDNDMDVGFCDSEEDLIALGKADATSVAKYFGLSSSQLGVDYSDDSNVPTVDGNKVYVQEDSTDPDICYIEEESCDYEEGLIRISVTAKDYDSPMLYYSYSIDGGANYSPLLAWPECNILEGYSPDTFCFDIEIEPGVTPQIIVRAYNQYDHLKESNILTSYQMFPYPEIAVDEVESTEPTTDSEIGADSDDILIIKKDTETEVVKESTFLTFLKICLACVAILFLSLFVTKIFTSRKRKKRKRKHKRKK